VVEQGRIQTGDTALIVEFGFKLSRRFGLNLARQKAAFVQIG
jgi:hypothetical protein